MDSFHYINFLLDLDRISRSQYQYNPFPENAGSWGWDGRAKYLYFNYSEAFASLNVSQRNKKKAITEFVICIYLHAFTAKKSERMTGFNLFITSENEV